MSYTWKMVLLTHLLITFKCLPLFWCLFWASLSHCSLSWNPLHLLQNSDEDPDRDSLLKHHCIFKDHNHCQWMSGIVLSCSFSDPEGGAHSKWEQMRSRIFMVYWECLPLNSIALPVCRWVTSVHMTKCRWHVEISKSSCCILFCFLGV